MVNSGRLVQQAIVIAQQKLNDTQIATKLSLFNESGEPFTFGSGSNGIAPVNVVTGQESRPSAPVVFWLGGNVQPENMTEVDVWFAEGEPADISAPSVPSSLFASNVSSTGFTLTWNASTDNKAVAGYEVRINGGAATSATSPRVFSGLNPNTLYNVEVRSVDTSNNVSNWSSVLPVTTTSSSASFLSVFGNSAPGSLSVFNDGGGSLRVANYFYGTRPWTVRGARIWNPADADSTFLNSDVTVFAFAKDWVGATFVSNLNDSPSQSKTYTETRVAGTWTDILFDAPISLLQANAAANGNDALVLGYQFAGGTYYSYQVHGDSLPITSSEDSQVHLAEAAFPRSTNNLGGGNANVKYGIDVLFEEA